MEYCWGDHRLDRERALLTRNGQPIDVSRKVLDCISHLVEQRDRVVSYDELIRKVWGHDNVTNHQLSQVVLAARRALGDDGQAQRLIRTMPGLGYRWVGEVIDGEQAAITASATSSEDMRDVSAAQAPLLVPETSPTTPVLAEIAGPETSPTAPVLVATADAATMSYSRAAVLGLLLVLCAGTFLLLAKPGGDLLVEPAGTPVDLVVALNDALRAGHFEEVREGLATLPAHLADTADARILEIELDFYRGRLTNAHAKLESQLSRPEAAADPILRARLLVLMSRVKTRMGITPSEGLALAQSTIAFLDSVGDDVPPDVRAQALLGRALGVCAAEEIPCHR